MLFFKKKKEEKMPPLGKGFVPTERVKELSKKGFSESEIIDILRKEGFSAEEIDKGLTQALKVSVTEAKPEEPTFPPKPEERLALPTLEEIKPAKPEVPVVPEETLPEEYYEAYPTEEYVDYLVKERMKEIDQRIKEFSSRYNELERKISEIHSKLSLLTKEEKPPAIQELVLTKMDAFKETVDDVSIRLSSLERAFKETLPALIESVRALSDLVQRLKREA